MHFPVVSSNQPSPVYPSSYPKIFSSIYCIFYSRQSVLVASISDIIICNRKYTYSTYTRFPMPSKELGQSVTNLPHGFLDRFQQCVRHPRGKSHTRPVFADPVSSELDRMEIDVITDERSRVSRFLARSTVRSVVIESQILCST